ncbi:MAG TPA: ASCH domain-containing protein [Candidatus Krumholzibacteria bacterium]
MPSLNFQSRFAPLVESGKKRQTIRAYRKDGRDPKPGDTLYFYTGLRTKRCRKLGEARCESAEAFEIDQYGCAWKQCREHPDSLEPVRAPELGWIATRDGFRSYEEMRSWFERTHGLPFEGFLIRW